MKKEIKNQPLTSKQAYFNEDNELNRNTHRKSIITFLKANPLYSFTARQIASKTAINRMAVVRRMSEIVADGHAKITGTKIENGQSVQVYQYDPEGIAKKPGLTKVEILNNILKTNLDPVLYDYLMKKYEDELKLNR